MLPVDCYQYLEMKREAHCERAKLGGDSKDGREYDVDCDGIQLNCKVGSGSEGRKKGAVTMELRPCGQQMIRK